MKNLVYLFVLMLLLGSLASQAQNTAGKADDEERISIGVTDPDNVADFSFNALNILKSRISKAVSLNGLSAANESAVINIKPIISILSKEITATAPPMVTAEVEVAMLLTDKYKGNSYGEVIYQFRGVGQTEEAAFTEAFKRLNPRDPKMRAFIQKGKEETIRYYNSHCDIVLSKANGYISAKQYRKAYELLMNVPPVSRECYDKAMLKISEFGDKVPGSVEDPQPETSEEADMVSSQRIELLNGLIIDYRSGKYYGEKLVLSLQVMNPTGEEQEIEIRGGAKSNYLINEEGEEIGLTSMDLANKQDHWELEYTILPRTPVEFRCTFPKEKYVRQLVLYINDNVHKLNHLPIQK
ncbi:MAG: hypothetical protein K9G67_09435 [Bacteroidales bacterium]|nr:hypothetical protein [Bacteroidales bacterium]MCF8344525.1 hypothetical protein [Bacteroidales bacterium]MCF8349702.1 hypothetical protein [Bacteroidales bacterium]MCF8376564.1 hypothetical protein [Bacteroidales bacterium]